jgi:predicted transcriptional regulator
VQTVFKGKIGSLEEVSINTTFGIKKMFSVSPSFMRDENKNVYEILFVCRDITFDKERHGRLLFGSSYLISEQVNDTAFEVFTGMLRGGNPGLYVGRIVDSELKNVFSDVSPLVVRLSKDEDKKSLTVSNFDKLLPVLNDFVSKKQKSIILLDRVEYLIINSSFENVIKNIYRLNDMIKEHNCLLLIRINPALIDKTQMAILKEELNELPERQIDDVQLEETLFEILEYIQIENKRNAIVSYSRIGKQFTISKVTTQKRIESLLEKGLIFSKKQGRIKTLYITDKGKNLLTQRTII